MCTRKLSKYVRTVKIEKTESDDADPSTKTTTVEQKTEVEITMREEYTQNSQKTSANSPILPYEKEPGSKASKSKSVESNSHSQGLATTIPETPGVEEDRKMREDKNPSSPELSTPETDVKRTIRNKNRGTPLRELPTRVRETPGIREDKKTTGEMDDESEYHLNASPELG